MSTSADLVPDRICALLAATARPDEIDPADYDAIYFTGGHAVMWDFPDSEGLQAITRSLWESGKIVGFGLPRLLRALEHAAFGRSPAGRWQAPHRVFLDRGGSGRRGERCPTSHVFHRL